MAVSINNPAHARTPYNHHGAVIGNGRVGTAEIREGRHGGSGGRVDQGAVVVQHVQIHPEGPALLSRQDAQTLRIDGARIFQDAVHEPLQRGLFLVPLPVCAVS